MKQLLPAGGPHPAGYVPLQMGQPITDRNYSQMQCKANVRQQGQPLPRPQQR
jgi:hypothetical protein